MKNIGTFGILILIIAVMYFLMIRPQKKKQKETENMRNNLHAGDEIVTIGGLRGKIVKEEDDYIVVQAGADKLKLDMMKWSVSKVTERNAETEENSMDPMEKNNGPETPKKSLPKKISKSN